VAKELHNVAFSRPCPRHRVMSYFKEYYQANMASRIVTRLPREVRLIGWKLPAEGRVKLNMIGACKDGCKVSCGGFIRDRQGKWAGGFAKHVGIVVRLWRNCGGC
jgi:hypothetical protein